jgi:hypothetical protein
LLAERGQLEEAVVQGREYLAIVRRERLQPTDRWVQQALTLALAQNEEHVEAHAVIDQAIDETERLGSGGMTLGVLYETKARAAHRMGDRAMFDDFAERCAREYRKGRNPVLSARFARLIEEAREVPSDPSLPPPATSLLLMRSESETGFDTVDSRMLECVDQLDRARCALTMLLQNVNSLAGWIYGVNAGATLNLLASVPDDPSDERILPWLEARLREELDADLSATVTADGDDVPSTNSLPVRFVDRSGRAYEPIFLSVSSDEGRRIAAVLALHVTPGPRTVASKELLAEIAGQLLEHGDVTGAIA